MGPIVCLFSDSRLTQMFGLRIVTKPFLKFRLKSLSKASFTMQNCKMYKTLVGPQRKVLQGPKGPSRIRLT